MNARSHRVEWPCRVGERPGSCRRDLGHASGARYQVQDVRPTRLVFSPLVQRGLNGGLCSYGDDPRSPLHGSMRCALAFAAVLVALAWCSSQLSTTAPAIPPASQRAGGQVQVDSDSAPSVAQSCLCHSSAAETARARRAGLPRQSPARISTPTQPISSGLGQGGVVGQQRWQ
jgi:hypothetical protein